MPLANVSHSTKLIFVQVFDYFGVGSPSQAFPSISNASVSRFFSRQYFDIFRNYERERKGKCKICWKINKENQQYNLSMHNTNETIDIVNKGINGSLVTTLQIYLLHDEFIHHAKSNDFFKVYPRSTSIPKRFMESLTFKIHYKH